MWGDYEKYLLRLVKFRKPNYSKLMWMLHNHPFYVLLEMDQNRAEDGMLLRDDFAGEIGCSSIGFTRDCCVLEMLVAFAIRIDEEYIGDPKEPHPEIIFWEMIKNLKLDRCNDDHFNANHVSKILSIWLEREFRSDGSGSIFPLKNADKDQRMLEISLQMNDYLYEKYH